MYSVRLNSSSSASDERRRFLLRNEPTASSLSRAVCVFGWSAHNKVGNEEYYTSVIYVSMDWKAGIYKHGVYTNDKNEHTCDLGHFSSFVRRALDGVYSLKRDKCLVPKFGGMEKQIILPTITKQEII